MLPTNKTSGIARMTVSTPVASHAQVANVEDSSSLSGLITSYGACTVTVNGARLSAWKEKYQGRSYMRVQRST